MSGIKCIADIKDIYDLYNYFIDRDHDGDCALGGSFEMSPRIVATFEKGLGRTEPHEADGYIQPSEMMRIRGTEIFSEQQVDEVSRFELHSKDPFQGIEELTEEREFGGIPLKAGEVMLGCSGVLHGTLSRETTLPGASPEMLFPADSEVRLVRDESGKVDTVSVRLGQDAVVDSMSLEAGSTVVYEKGRLARIRSSHPFVVKGYSVTEVSFYKRGRLKFVKLAEPAEAHATWKTPYLFTSGLWFRKNGNVERGTLARAVEGSDIGEIPPGIEIYFGYVGTPEGTEELFRAKHPDVEVEIEADLGEMRRSRQEVFHYLIRGMAYLHSAFLVNLRKIRVVDPAPEPSETWGAQAGVTGVIVRADRISDKGLFVHEAAHLLTNNLPRQFMDRWKRIAGEDLYHGKPIGSDFIGGLRLYNGCASDYGCRNRWEDVAEYTRWAIVAPDRFRSKLEALERKNSPDVEVYYKKLALLREYDFLTEEQYRKIVPNDSAPTKAGRF